MPNDCRKCQNKGGTTIFFLGTISKGIEQTMSPGLFERNLSWKQQFI